MKNTKTQTVPHVELRIHRKGRITTTNNPINTPDAVYQLLRGRIGSCDREHLVVIGLDVKSNPIYYEVVHIGTLTHTLIHPREVLKGAIIHNCFGIVIAHNHPTGDTRPSQSDIDMTTRIDEASAILGIHMMDHLIIGQNGYHSIKSNTHL